jgi:hypothetical protein
VTEDTIDTLATYFKTDNCLEENFKHKFSYKYDTYLYNISTKKVKLLQYEYEDKLADICRSRWGIEEAEHQKLVINPFNSFNII